MHAPQNFAVMDNMLPKNRHMATKLLNHEGEGVMHPCPPPPPHVHVYGRNTNL